MANTGVYCIYNNKNGKRYIGSTSVSFESRFKKHKWLLRNNKHNNKRLQNAWNKYKEESFEFIEIVYCKPDYCIKFEQSIIDTLNPEYNICKVAGSTRGVFHTDESIQKMRESKKISQNRPEVREKLSKARKGRFKGKDNPFYGKKHSEESKKKRLETWYSTSKKAWNKGKKMSDSFCKKMSKVQKGKKKGPMCDNTRVKLSKTRTEKYGVKIIDNNSVIYNSIKEASIKLNISRSCIDKVLKGKRKQAKGYTFSYV